MQIKLLDDSALPAWNRFVEAHPEATFCHLGQWKTVIETVFKHRCYFYYAEQDGAVTAVLPMAHVKSRLFGNALVSTPFCVYGGVLAGEQAARGALEEQARQTAQRLKVAYLELRYRRRVNEDWPCKDDLYVMFRKQIDPDVEQNMLNIPRKQRAMVRKGIKAGLQVEVDDHVDRFYDVYATSVRNHGTPVFSKKFFHTLKKLFGDQCEVQLAHLNGDVISGVMSFYFRDEVLPYYGGGYPDARRYKAFDFMYWELMRRACESGIKWFDYGRSKVGTGSYSFKKNWGFVPEPLHYEYQLIGTDNIPEVNPLNPKYRLFIEVWKKLPVALTKVIGPPIVRNLG